MRHTLKESILQGPVRFYVGPRTKLSLPPVRSFKRVNGEALHYDAVQTMERVAILLPQQARRCHPGGR